MRVLFRLLLCLLPLPALARGPVTIAPSSLCAAAIAAAEWSGRLPEGMLTAIAQVESGRPDPDTGRLNPWPWTINAAGVGQFFATKAQAIAAVQALQADGIRSIDVGCLQVNRMFHPEACASLQQAFDPQANAAYAVHFLNALYADSHDWKQAIAAYHSSTAVLGDDYRRRVMALWHDPDLAGWGLGLAVAYRDFPPQRQIYGDFAPASQVYGAFVSPSVEAALPR